MSTALDTATRAREGVERIAEEAFAQHVLVQQAENRWRCATPGTSIYAFNVVILPGIVLVYGDVGDSVFRHGYSAVPATIGWLRGAHWDYLCGKMMFREAFRKFYAGDAVAWMRDGDGDIRDEVEDLAQSGDLYEHEWHRIVSERGLDPDAHAAGAGWSESAFWAVACVKKFVALYDAQARSYRRQM